MTKKGLWICTRIDEDDNPIWSRVSQSFELRGMARGAPNAKGETDSWGMLVRFRNHDGKARDVIVGFADLHSDVGPLCGSLADKGMDIERLTPEGSRFRRRACPRTSRNRRSHPPQYRGLRFRAAARSQYRQTDICPTSG
jgi:hypothetical protein